MKAKSKVIFGRYTIKLLHRRTQWEQYAIFKDEHTVGYFGQNMSIKVGHVYSIDDFMWVRFKYDPTDEEIFDWFKKKEGHQS
jgi:hypothetical protein